MADIETKLIDKRVAHRYVRKGILDDKEWDRHLKSLPDLAEQALPLEALIDNDDLDDEDEEPVEAPVVSVASVTPVPGAPGTSGNPA